MPQSDTQRKRIYCNSCRRETNHVVRGEYNDHHPLSDDGDYETYFAPPTELCGLRHAHSGNGMERLYACQRRSNSEHIHLRAGTRRQFTSPEGISSHPRRSSERYIERAFLAYNHGLSVLCAAGLRALIEGICADKNIPEGP
jgi:hypothetical protein